MSAISPHALAVLLKGKDENEMVYVITKDSIGHKFSGRVLAVDGHTFDIEAVDGDVTHHIMVRGILYVDVLPFQRYNGYGVSEFVFEFGPCVS